MHKGEDKKEVEEKVKKYIYKRKTREKKEKRMKIVGTVAAATALLR